MSKPPNTREDQDILEGKVFAILAYLSILCIIPLVFKKGNSFALKHAKQGLVIFVAWVAFFVLHIVLGDWLLQFGNFICGLYSFIGIIFAIKGEYIRLWLAADIAENITI